MIETLYMVIVNWNLKDDTIACIDSLFAAGAISGQVIVVDNGSSDGSVFVLQERFGSSIVLIRNTQNLGFAAGSNLGIRYALDCGARWILLLNNDTYVASNFLSEMERAVKYNQGLGILGPVVLNHNFPDRIWYFGDRLIPGLLITYSPYRGFIYREQFPLLVHVDFVNGCGMLVKSDVFKRVGVFDTAYFMYGEEVDLCWRARKAGFRLAVATRAKMWHKVSMSANRNQRIARYLRTRNQIRFYRTYSRSLQFPAMFLFTMLRVLYVLANDLISGQVSLIEPLILGWIHGWLNYEDTTRRW